MNLAWKVFCRLVSIVSKGRFSASTVESVLNTYLSYNGGLGTYLENHEEFKDNYFGIFRFTKKGFRNFKKSISQAMERKLYMAKLEHNYNDRKREWSRLRKTKWEIDNMVDGHLFSESADIKKYGKKKYEHKRNRINYFSKKQHRELNKREK